MPSPTGLHWGWARGSLCLVLVAGILCLAALDAWAQGHRGFRQAQGQLDSVLKKLIGRSSLKSADVDALIKQANNDLRISQNHMFNGRHQEASALLDKVAKLIRKIKQADPANSKLTLLEQKYARHRRDVDRRLRRQAARAASSSTPSTSAFRAVPAAAKLPHGVTKRLKDFHERLDSAETVLTKESNVSDKWRAEQAEYELRSADRYMAEIVKMYGDQISMDHPDIAGALARQKEIQGKVNVFAAAVAEVKAQEEAVRKAALEAGEAERAAKKAEEEAWKARVIDKNRAAKDWVTLERLADKFRDSLSSEGYFTKAGATFIPEWREWKDEFLPFWKIFEQRYGKTHADVFESFKGVRKPLDVSLGLDILYGKLANVDVAKQEKTYVDWAVKRGRYSYMRWKRMTSPDPTKVELKFDYTERALNSFKIAKAFDPDSGYDDFIAEAQAARDETYPEWVEALKKLTWPGHNAAFAGPGRPTALAAAALNYLKRAKHWSKPEYDDVHIPVAACVTARDWAVSKKNVRGQPLQYSINMTVAFEGKKDPKIAYVYNMVFYTREELGVKKGLPFMYANSRQYEKYRMLKSKVRR